MARPSVPLLSREGAARAALDVIDKHGLKGWSLDEVARTLGVRAPSLYHHFKGKSDLLAEVATLILRDIPAPPINEADWEESVIRLCLAARNAILRHPNAATLLLQFFPKQVFVKAYDFWASVCPFHESRQLILLEGLEKLTFGSALFSAAARSAGHDGFPEVNANELPHLARALDADVQSDEQRFVETLRCFLAGFRGQPLREDLTLTPGSTTIPLRRTPG
jgi:AcrR family transcriptional regulator